MCVCEREREKERERERERCTYMYECVKEREVQCTMYVCERERERVHDLHTYALVLTCYWPDADTMISSHFKGMSIGM